MRNKGNHSFQLLKENNNHLSFNQSCEFLKISLAIYSHSEHINMHGERKIKKKFYFKNYFYFWYSQIVEPRTHFWIWKTPKPLCLEIKLYAQSVNKIENKWSERLSFYFTTGENLPQRGMYPLFEHTSFVSTLFWQYNSKGGECMKKLILMSKRLHFHCGNKTSASSTRPIK